MTTTIEKTEDGKLSCKTPEGTVVNFNFSQRSSLDALADCIKTWRKKENPEAPTTPTLSAVPVALGAAQFAWGIVCVALGVIVSVLGISCSVYYSNTLYWVGIPFIISGLFETLVYKWRQWYWVTLSFICQMLSLCVSIPGLIFINESREWPMYYSDPCESLLSNLLDKPQYNVYEDFNLSRPNNNYNIDKERFMEECRRYAQQYQDLLNGLMIVLMIMTSCGLLSSVVAFFYKIKDTYNSCSSYKGLDEENDESEKPHEISF